MKIIRLAPLPATVYGLWIAYVVSTIPGTRLAHEYLGYIIGAGMYANAASTLRQERSQ